MYTFTRSYGANATSAFAVNAIMSCHTGESVFSFCSDDSGEGERYPCPPVSTPLRPSRPRFHPQTRAPRGSQDSSGTADRRLSEPRRFGGPDRGACRGRREAHARGHPRPPDWDPGARRTPHPPEEFVAIQVGRLNEALLVAYSAMTGANLKAGDRVVKIVREFDRYNGFAAAERRLPEASDREAPVEGAGVRRGALPPPGNRAARC